MSAPPLEGRRLYFVGIGGAGLSAYANFAREWGAGSSSSASEAACG